MREYGKVFTALWSSETFRSMTEDARALALYLLSSPHGTIAGVFRLPDGYVCEDMQWTSERVAKGFIELFQKGFANRCETTKWVWVCKHLEWNPPENPNQRKAAQKIADQVPPECVWKLDFMRVCGVLIGINLPPNFEPLLNPLQTVPQPGTVTGTGTGEKKSPAKRAPSHSTFEPPDWINREHWDTWHSCAKRKKATDAQKRMAVDKLQGWRDAGIDYASALENAALGGWQGLFEPDKKPRQAPSTSGGVMAGAI